MKKWKITLAYAAKINPVISSITPTVRKIDLRLLSASVGVIAASSSIDGSDDLIIESDEPLPR